MIFYFFHFGTRSSKLFEVYFSDDGYFAFLLFSWLTTIFNLFLFLFEMFRDPWSCDPWSWFSRKPGFIFVIAILQGVNSKNTQNISFTLRMLLNTEGPHIMFNSGANLALEVMGVCSWTSEIRWSLPTSLHACFTRDQFRRWFPRNKLNLIGVGKYYVGNW